MATNPPITIGPFANVPAPGSGVKSDWAQQITHYVTERELFNSTSLIETNITATTQPTAQTVLAAPAVVYDGRPVMLEFACTQVLISVTAGGFMVVNLWDGSTDLGFWAQEQPGITGTLMKGMTLRRRITPTAGSHTFSVRAWVSSGSSARFSGLPPQQLPSFFRGERV
jgi:hypothetical protein